MSGDPVELALLAAICLAGGFLSGIVGVGGGIVFVPALVVILDLPLVEAEATSLLMIAIVCAAGATRQHRHGNVAPRQAAMIALLSPVGVLIGVVIANEIPARALELGFAALLLFVAYRLVRAPGDSGPGPEPVRDPTGGPPAPGGPSGAGPVTGGPA